MQDQRKDALGVYVKNFLHTPGVPELCPLGGDASFRRYFRCEGLIAVDSPPDTQKNAEFVRIDRALAAEGIRVPGIIACDLQQGFMLLEDLGDCLFADVAAGADQEQWYQQAAALLPGLAKLALPGLPPFDRAFIRRELEIFTVWMLHQAAGCEPGAGEQQLLEETYARLETGLTALVQCPVHRDFHSRNLMICSGSLAVIDFQDMVQGPLGYDAASLLFDCYIKLNESLIARLTRLIYLSYLECGLLPRGYSQEKFSLDLRLISLQRHLKVLGIFERLSLRDGKHGYLKDLPRVYAYALDECEALEGFGLFRRFLQDKVGEFLACEP